MKILLDAMGGGNAPEATIKGAVNAIKWNKSRSYFNWKTRNNRSKSKRILRKNFKWDITKIINKKCNRNNRNGRWTNR